MASITDNITYINLSKLNDYNQSLDLNLTGITFETIKQNMLGVFAQYTILQWFLSFIVFISILMILKYLLQNEFLTDIQLVLISSFVVIGMNILLLLFTIFTITAPLQLFFLIWLISLIMIILKK